MSKQACHALLMLAAVAMIGPEAARAQQPETDQGPPVERPAAGPASAREGLLLPETLSPASDRTSRATLATWAGYDQARRSAVVMSDADLKVWGPLDFRLGVTYLPDGETTDPQPRLGLRLRMLSQKDHRVDLAGALFYRLDRFTLDAGVIQAELAFGKRIGPVGIFANVSFDSDMEGDDREGELKLATLYQASQRFQLGFDGRLRFDLFSSDARRRARGNTSFDLSAGPIAYYGVGPVALFGQVGVTALKAERLRAGVLAMGGVGAAY